MTLGPAIFDRDVAALDIAGFVETSPDGVKSAGVTVRAAEEPDHRHCRLLRERRERPRGSRAAEQRDELAPSHVGHQPPHSLSLLGRCTRKSNRAFYLSPRAIRVKAHHVHADIRGAPAE